MRSKLLPAIIFFILMGQALYAATPAITSFSPASGPVGTLVTITGTNLGTPTAFSIGGKTAIVVSNNGTQLVGLVMPGAATGPVTVTTAGGTGNATSNFTITARPAVNMIQNGYVLEGSELSTSQGYSVAISADGKTAVIGGVSGNSGGHYNAEIAYVFTYAADTWTLQAGLQGAASTPDQSSSSAVAISADGNTILLGASFDGGGNGGIGSVYAFTRSGTTWTQQGAALIGTGITGIKANQGISVALSADGNTAAIGGWGDNSQVGAIWIFTRTGGVWKQQGNKLVGTGYIGESSQGVTVALSADGNTLIEGGEFDNNYVGAAWIFSRSGSVWTQQGNKLVGNDVVTGGLVEQGHGVAISADGNTVMVGGPGDANTGAAWVYTRTGSAWTQQGSKLVGTGYATKYVDEGSSVALSADGNLALIGGNEDYTTVGPESILGSTWEFSRSGATWTQIWNKLVGQAGGGYDDQGFSVALSADGITALVGADERLNGEGSAYVFTTVPPIAVTLPATSIAGTTATLNGTVDEDLVTSVTQLPNYSSAATTVTIVYGTSPTLATKTTATLTTGTSPMPGGAAKTTFTSALTGLTPGTTYYFMITGVNAFGTSQGAILNFKTTTSAAAPTAVTLAATALNYSGATLNGTVNDNGAATTVQFQYGTAADLSGAITAPVTTGVSPIPAGGGTTKFAGYLAGLYPSTTYYFRIFGTNSAGTTYGPILSFTTPAQPAITFTSPGYVIYGSITAPIISSTDPTTPFHYQSGNSKVAAITADGKFQAVGVGTTTIVAYQYAPGTTQIEASASGSITVIPAPLTITPDNKSIAFGQPAPAFTATYTGFVNGDTPASLPAGAMPVLTTQYVTGSQAGAYYILNSPTGNSTGGNYNITYANGTLTVTQLYPKPIATTIAATNITATGATINGIVSTNQGPNTTVTLQYTDDDGDGLEDLITATLTTGPNPLPAGSGSTNYSAILTGLKPSTTYYFIINGINPEFTTTGKVFTFTTPAAVAGPVITFAPPAPEIYGSPDVTPGATVTNSDIAITYASSNPQVATIVDNKIHIIGVGISQITASLNGTAAIPVTQAFTVTQAPLTIAADNKTMIVGGPLPQLTVSYTGFVNNDTQASLTTQPVITTTATTKSSTGPYPITVSGAADPNYSITYKAGTLTVTGAQLTFNPIPPKTYGNTDFDPGATGAGITYSSSDTSTAVIVSGLIHIKNAGTSIITASNSSGSLQQTLTVNKAVLTITANNLSKIYGSNNPALTLSYSGFVYSDGSSKLSPQASATTTATATSPVSSYQIIANGAASRDYSISYVNGTLTISPAPLTIAADNKAKTVGTANPVLTITYTGFVNDEDQDNLTTQPTIATTATTISQVGTYPITVSGATDANYNITYKTGTLTINGMLTFNPIAAKTYGDPDFDPGAIGTAITYASSNTGVATIVSGKIHIVSAGTSTITVTSGAGGSAQQLLTINKAALTITANNLSKAYGTANPVLTLSYSGFVNDEDASVLTTQATVTTVATTTSAIGSYQITPTGATAANYTINYVNGTLTITLGMQTITFNPIASKMYASPDFDPGATASSGAAIIYTSSNTEVATIVNNEIHIISVGTSTITATVAPNSNYSNTPTATQLLTVTQAIQTITFNPIPDQERQTTYDLSGVTASSGLPVTFTLSDPMVASINGTTLSSNELGVETITASQAGNVNYLPATNVQQTYNVTDPKGDKVLVSFVVSPNGDGINDVLVVQGIQDYPDNKMILINRNGVKIYEATGYNNGSRVFDGHSSVTGALQQAGTLLYVLEYRVNGQMKRKTGFTELRY